MWQGGAERGTGTSSVPGATTAIITAALTGVISASAAASCSTIVPGGLATSRRRKKRREIARLFRLGLPAARVILPKRCDSKHLLGAILENIELGSIVYSDRYRAYNKLSFNGFHHKCINHDKTLVDGKVPINGSESSRGYAKSLSPWL